MGLFDVLRVGANGMSAYSYASGVAAADASNVSTPGYSRRLARIESVVGPPNHGLGARATGQLRVIDQLLERRVLGGRSATGEADARASALSTLGTTFGDKDGNLSDALDALSTALGDLANHPAEPSARITVLARADQVAQAFNRAADELATARADANAKVASQVDELDAQLGRIAELGQKISKAELGGSEASDLRDQRDELVRQVASLVPVKVIPEDNGQLSLLLGGSLPLVSADGSVHPLTTRTDATSGDMVIEQTVAGAARDVSGLLDSGSLGGLISARDGGLTTARDSLDQLALDVSVAYNATHAAGFGLDGVGGRNLFSPLVTTSGAANSLSLSSDVAGNPDAIAAASDATALSGDNLNALALLGVSGLLVAGAGTRTLGDSFAALVGQAGSDRQGALLDQDQAQAMEDQLDAMRESVSGVSSDDEMVALMRFSRAYQASLKVVQIADEMLGELMHMKR